MNRLELKIPPVAVFVAFGALMWAIARALPQATLPVPGAAALAATLSALGAALAVAGILAFRRQDTTVHPIHPHKASAIVSEGIYRYTRNPMYLGLALFLLAWAAWLGNLVSFTGVPAFVAYMTRFQIRPEERALLAKFGPAFSDYMQTVRRWM
jgi:protein-S-isoprenylcysteine O-methyltransferase Ste14